MLLTFSCCAVVVASKAEASPHLQPSRFPRPSRQYGERCRIVSLLAVAALYVLLNPVQWPSQPLQDDQVEASGAYRDTECVKELMRHHFENDYCADTLEMPLMQSRPRVIRPRLRLCQPQLLQNTDPSRCRWRIFALEHELAHQ